MVDGKLHLNSLLSEVEQNGILKTTAAKKQPKSPNTNKKYVRKRATNFLIQSQIMNGH